jgi:hypothetical protein
MGGSDNVDLRGATNGFRIAPTASLRLFVIVPAADKASEFASKCPWQYRRHDAIRSAAATIADLVHASAISASVSALPRRSR